MSTVNIEWTSADLAKAVCDEQVAQGLLKEKPAFIRGDREKKFAQLFQSARLDGAKMHELNGRGVEVVVRDNTQGEAWVDDLQQVLKGMMSDAQAADVTTDTPGHAGPESEEMPALPGPVPAGV